MAPVKQSKLKLKESIIEFYKLYSKKGHVYTYNQGKCCDLSERTIYRLLEKFDKKGNIDRKSQRKMDHQVSLNSKYLYVTYF